MARRQILLMIATALVCVAWLWRPLAAMWDMWLERPEYSHSMLLLPLAAWFAWRTRQDWWPHIQPDRSGLWLALLGIVIALLGELSALFVLSQYGFVLMMLGMLLAATGWSAARRVWICYALILLMVPLPAFFLNSLSSQLQLLSSQLGVAVIRLFGISVYLEGNVIDLGANKLQVAEACDGLRYIFPLLTLGFVMAYFFRVSWWKRALLFLSAIPVAIVMNGLRVGSIGLLVERWGPTMAEGFFHEFQGWLVFMFSFALLFVVMSLLARLGPDATHWRAVFSIDPPRTAAIDAAATASRPRAFWPAAVTPVILLLVAVGGLVAPARAQQSVGRASFAQWPLDAGSWLGRRAALEAIYLDALKLDDYVLADYVRGKDAPVNLYIAYYDSQRAGQSAHSPRSCLPGGGWQIRSMRTVALGIPGSTRPTLSANRVLIEQGNQRQLVYYWFDQRGRVVTNELLVKWYILWDALWRNRTDGALVRLTTPIRPDQTEANADRSLQEFAAAVTPRLHAFIPD